MTKKVEAGEKKGTRAIKRGCIVKDKLRLGERDLSGAEVVDEQPKLTDPGVTDIPEEDEYNVDLGNDGRVKEKPPYVTRAVAAKERAGLDTVRLGRNHQLALCWTIRGVMVSLVVKNDPMSYIVPGCMTLKPRRARYVSS